MNEPSQQSADRRQRLTEQLWFTILIAVDAFYITVVACGWLNELIPNNIDPDSGLWEVFYDLRDIAWV